MQIVIDIPENEYKLIKEVYEKNDIVESTYSYIYHGTPLPEHHGRLISEEDMLSVIMFSKLFDDAKVREVKEALLNIPTIIEGSDANEDSD